MVIAGVVCDVIFMYVHKSRERYRQGKFSVCEIRNGGSSATETLVRDQVCESIEIINIKNIFFAYFKKHEMDFLPSNKLS